MEFIFEAIEKASNWMTCWLNRSFISDPPDQDTFLTVPQNVQKSLFVFFSEYQPVTHHLVPAPRFGLHFKNPKLLDMGAVPQTMKTSINGYDIYQIYHIWYLIHGSFCVWLQEWCKAQVKSWFSQAKFNTTTLESWTHRTF